MTTTRNLNELLGKRVRTTRDIEVFPTGYFKSGLTGVVSVAHDKGPSHDQYVMVKLDEHFPALDQWENQLEVWVWEDVEADVFAALEVVS